MTPRHCCGLDARRRSPCAGFTLVELLVTLVMLSVVALAILSVMLGANWSKASTINQLESVQAARGALDRMAVDLRTAGFGTDADYLALPQPAIAYIDSLELLINANIEPYPDTSAVRESPLAYDPAGSPRPFPLQGTSYAPPIKYRSGAETIRWTLDANDDGAVDANDIVAPAGADAQRTPNPNDYVLIRQVYGDSTGNVAGANGGAVERIALVSRPGGGIPPMFRVFFKDVAQPWDWSNGPVPASMLAQISRVAVEISAPSSRENHDGSYAQNQLRTQVLVSRNSPTAAKRFAVDGYVYNDANRNNLKDPGELGISNALVRLGSAHLTYTSASGHFLFSVQEGTYVLKHTAPAGYGVFTSPDSTTLTVGPARTFSFADTARAGGIVKVTAFDDLNQDGVRGWDEPGRANITIASSPGAGLTSTNSSGLASVFVPPGSYSVGVVLPDSLATTTTNPVTGTMINGDSAIVSFGIRSTPTGRITGRVYVDANRNGILDAGETGAANVWVACTKNSGATVLGGTFTDASGDYSLVVPVNDPPHTSPYALYLVPNAGYFPTTSSGLSGIWVVSGTDVTGKDFGVAGFQLITLNATRILSLASADLVEKDWPTTQTSSRVQDRDLVMGSDANGTDQLSAWFNRYSSTPLFNSTPDYVRSAAGGVLSLSLDTLDTGINLQRERYDLFAGTTWNSTNNNMFWYLTQNTSGNEGYLPTTYSRRHATNDHGDVTAVVQGDLVGVATPDGVDTVVGTKSPDAGEGTIELWKHNGASPPDWQRYDTYPPDGTIPGNLMGEVTGLALADFDGDGLRDLVATTRTLVGSYSGQIMFFKHRGKTQNPVYLYSGVQTLTTDLPQAVTVMDVDGDGLNDVVVGTKTGDATGRVQYWRNGGSFSFTKTAEVAAPGFVTSITAADLGGGSGRDLAVGFGTSSAGYGGGVVIYYTDVGTLVANAVDPTGGAVVNRVPAITTGNFDYGTYPSTPFPPYLTDIAIGVKSSSTTGALVVILR